MVEQCHDAYSKLGGELSMLESSPGVIAVIIVFFLIFTLGLEFLLHRTRRALRRRRKAGLLAAVNHLSSELMLLGSASLILIALEPTLEKVCLPANSVMRPWLSHVSADGCACCLLRTEGVSDCFLEDRQCPADAKQQCEASEAHGFTSVILKREKQLGQSHAQRHSQEFASPSPHARRLFAEAAGNASEPAGGEAEPVCDGITQIVWKVCGNRPGYAPAVTNDTVEEIHMFLFLIAVVHILVGIIALVLSTLKLKTWHRMADSEDEDPRMEIARAARLELEQQQPGSAPAQPAAAAAAAAKGAAVELQPARGAGSVAGDVEAGAGGDKNGGRAAAAAKGARPAHAAHDGGESSSEEEEEEAGEGAEGDGGGEGGARSLDADFAVQGYSPREWGGRADKLRGVQLVLEPLKLLWRQLSPWTVSRQEYALLRASFFLSHAPDPPLEKGGFHPYLLEAAERDGASVVGLGLITWLFIIAFVLVSSAIGWCAWLFSIIAGGLLLVLNTYLIALVRQATRGGAVRALRATPLWRHRHLLLLPLIKLLLFCLSFVISNSVFFGAFYGPQSCFFSRTGFQNNPVPWWVIIVADVGMMLSMALVTLPLYSLVAHTYTPNAAVLRAKARAAAHHHAAAAGGKAH